MSKVWKIWKYTLCSFNYNKKKRYYDVVCIIRRIIFTTYLITNCFITAGVIRHWDDNKPSPRIIPVSSVINYEA